MPPRHILSPQAHAALFDPPTDPAAIVRHYTFSPDDMALIRQCRRVANRIGFAINLAYLRFPGRVLGVGEMPPADMLAFIAGQIGCDRADFGVYAQRGETRREHLGELQAYLAARPFGREDKYTVAHVAIEQATGSDRGDVIVSAMIEHLREGRILLPALCDVGEDRFGRTSGCSQTRLQKPCRGPVARDDRRAGSSARRRRRR